MPSAAPASPARRRWTIEAEHRGRSIVVEGRSEVAGRHGHLQTVLEAVPDGDLDVRVFEGEVPVIFVRNDGALRFDIPGLEGEPFLRIGPDGVEGNARSPTFHRAARQRIGEVPADADPNAAPEWTTLSSTSAWGWLEFRARVPEGDDPFSGTRDPLALGSRKRTVLRWEVPSTLADEMAPIRGRVDWVPAVEASATPSLWAVVAAAVAALVLIVPIRRAVRRVRASRRGNLPTG
jgi:hypothetical protein